MLIKHPCYRVAEVAAELCEAAQLCVFILGTRYLNLGVLRRVFGVRYAVSVLVSNHVSRAIMTEGHAEEATLTSHSVFESTATVLSCIISVQGPRRHRKQEGEGGKSHAVGSK